MEHLNGRKIPTDERVLARIVIAALLEALLRTDRRWLLCLDNVDKAGEPNVNAVLNVVTSMKGNRGWIIVTSRTGSELLWNDTEPEQNFALQPLSDEEAMFVLWRMKMSRNTATVSDHMIKGVWVSVLISNRPTPLRSLR